MKIKKLLAVVLSVVVALGSLSLVACNNEKMANDGKTIDVKIIKGGYGTAWFEGIAEKFETLYAEEGYKVNILTPSNSYSGETVLLEMRNYKNDETADLYIVEGVYADDVIDMEYGICVEDLNEVYEKGAISFDGTVSDTPIKDTKGGKLYNYMVTDPLNENKYYSYLWHASMSGLVVNTKVLSDYGFDYMPNTTDEMFKMYDAIYNGANGKDGTKDESGIFPTTWGGENAYGYTYATMMINLASMLGHDGWEDFFTLDNVRDDIKNGYKYYEEIKPELKSAIKTFIKANDVMYSYTGSTTQRHDMAHAQLVMGNAAFMSNGSYFYNEVKSNFSKYLSNVRIIPVPMVSEFGVMLKLDGSGNDAKKCDEILSYLCGCFDSGMNQAEMLDAVKGKFSGITFTEEQIQKVWEARGITYQNLQGHAYIAKNSDVKEPATLLLRMMASEDAANLMAEYSLPAPFADTTLTEFEHEFIGDVMTLKERLNHSFFLYQPRGLRSEINMETLGYISANFVSETNATIGVEQDVSNRDYDYWAEYFYNKINDNVKTNWEKYVTNAGY